jgi:hypothetical protein
MEIVTGKCTVEKLYGHAGNYGTCSEMDSFITETKDLGVGNNNCTSLCGAKQNIAMNYKTYLFGHTDGHPRRQ